MKRMQRYGYGLVALVLVSATLAVPAGAGQEKVNKLVLSDGVAKVADTLEGTDAKDKVKNQVCKIYALDLKGGQTYQIDMTSKALDPYMRLEDGTGKELAQDDDSGGGLNARIIFSSPKDGAYRIIATTFGGGTGPFELTVKQTITAKSLDLALTAGEAKVEAELTVADANDAMRKMSVCKIYAIKLSKGKSYQIDMMSKKIDSYLRLEDATGKQLAQDDDSGDGLNARIVFNCTEDATYRIIATTFSGGEAGNGPFVLNVKEK